MEEKSCIKKKTYKGLSLFYREVYHMTYEVNENTGVINKDKKVKTYTKDQVNRNLQALKKAYHKVIENGLIGYFNYNFNKDFKKDKLVNSKALAYFLKYDKEDIEEVLKELFPNIQNAHLENYYIIDVKEFKNVLSD